MTPELNEEFALQVAVESTRHNENISATLRRHGVNPNTLPAIRFRRLVTEQRENITAPRREPSAARLHAQHLRRKTDGES